MNKTLLIACAPLLALGVACSTADEQLDEAGAYGSSSGTTSTSTSTSGVGGAGTSSSSSSSGSSTGGSEGPLPGTLTAGDWDDNVNWDTFLTYRAGALESPEVPATIDVADRIVIRVVNGQGLPLANAEVSVEGSYELLSGPTASDGRLLFFPSHDGAEANEPLTVTVVPPPGQDNLAPVTEMAPSTSEWEIVLPEAVQVLPTALDLAFVVDATGSMADELDYLTVELGGIADQVQQNFGPIDVRYGLVVYRDETDDYVTKTFDFTDDLQAFSTDLAAQSANGGGDTPEAMDAALIQMNELSWRTGNVARIAFLVADAPPHQPDGATVLAQADSARLRGIKLYPIAASGVDLAAEYYLRSAAQLTLGRYLFLTDDSGVGSSHAEPSILCYQVQYLNVLMNRMIASELSGTRVPADPEEVLRTVGQPNDDGTCTIPE